MDNAVKALLIAGGVLIGIMVVSLGVTLFSSLSKYNDTTQQQIEENALQKFNEKYIKFVNCADDSSTPEFTLTIQDVVTAASIAYENNKSYGLNLATEDNYYVTVNVDFINDDGVTDITNLEQIITGNIGNETRVANLLDTHISAKFRCTNAGVKIRENTQRVYELNFTEIQH